LGKSYFPLFTRVVTFFGQMDSLFYLGILGTSLSSAVGGKRSRGVLWSVVILYYRNGNLVRSTYMSWRCGWPRNSEDGRGCSVYWWVGWRRLWEPELNRHTILREQCPPTL
jgi:hypothetical protein